MHPPISVAKNLRILVVDDNESIHRDFGKILVRDAAEAEFDAEESAFFGAAPAIGVGQDFELSYASQGSAALETVESELAAGRRFAVVFMDVRMPPGWDGLETARRLWEVDPDLQMVICTAYSDKSWEEMAAELSNPERVLILKKPFDSIEVLQLAHALTEKWALVQAARINLQELEEMVAVRTRELIAANARLEEETARVSEQALLLEKARDAILVWDPDGTIRFWNHAAERLYGWTGAEACGRNAYEILNHPATDRDGWWEAGCWLAELPQTTRSGEPIVVECRWTLVRDDAGRPKSVMGIHSDITSRKQLEAKFLRVQRLDTIGTLAGGIAHDLNNILHPITLAMDFLHDSLEDAGSRKMLEMVMTNSQRASSLVKQVLSFARGVEGQREAVRPAELSSDISQIIRETFPKNIEFHHPPPAADCEVLGDATQLHMVLLNLCINARDAMPSGGRLGLEVDDVAVSESQCAGQPGAAAGPHVRFRITDSGCGIPADSHEKIFDPFYTTKEPGKGTGLGLSTSLSIINSHGGFITVDSQEDKGTRFDVFLPACDAAEPAPEKSHQTAWKGGGETLLVIDDEEAILRLVRLSLESSGYRVLTAANGAEGLEIFARHATAIHAVVTDLMMPVMDGLEMLCRLREIDPTLPVLVATGSQISPEIQAVRKLGVPVVLKPFTSECLLQAIRTLPPKSTTPRHAIHTH